MKTRIIVVSVIVLGLMTSSSVFAQEVKKSRWDRFKSKMTNVVDAVPGVEVKKDNNNAAQTVPDNPTGTRVVAVSNGNSFNLSVGRDKAIEEVREALRGLGYAIESTQEGVIRTEKKVSRFKKSEDWVEVDVLVDGRINVRAMHREGRTVTLTKDNNNPAVEQSQESVEVATKLRSKLATLVAAR